jgi:hypothetical protein
MYSVGTYKPRTTRSADPLVANPSFAEQENAVLDNFKSAAVHMKQTHLLWLVRFVLYRRGRKKKDGAYLHRDATKRQRAAAAAAAASPDGLDTPVVSAPASEPHEVAEVLGGDFH